MAILMCRPEFFGVEYEINPWMHVSVRVDHALADTQWTTLYATYQRGAQVPPVSSQHRSGHARAVRKVPSSNLNVSDRIQHSFTQHTRGTRCSTLGDPRAGSFEDPA